MGTVDNIFYFTRCYYTSIEQ